jgi:hypothetical protein
LSFYKVRLPILPIDRLTVAKSCSISAAKCRNSPSYLQLSWQTLNGLLEFKERSEQGIAAIRSGRDLTRFGGVQRAIR